MRMDTNLDDFYANSNVLITGSSGFIGKVLVEKLLRSQPNVKKLYLLIRSKKDKSSDERAQKYIFDQPIFKHIREKHPERLNKIVVISGDISKPYLGLNEQDIQLLQSEVNIIFNCAATLKMTATLKHSIKNNVLSVLELLKLCRSMEALKSIVIVSTAYSNCTRHVIGETIYNSHITPELVMEICNELNEETLEKIVPHILGGHPNTYTFTKLLMENTLQHFSDLPIVLFRPAIVVGSYMEPLPGWVDSLNGPTGLLYAGGVGILRALFLDQDISTNWVPVDMCTNALICSAWHGLQNRLTNPTEISVYNYSCDSVKRKYGELLEYMHSSSIKVRAMWKPFKICTTNKYKYYVLALLLHTIPAFFADILLALSGNKLRLSTIYKDKVNPTTEVLSFFTCQEWKITETNTYTMWKSLSDSEKERYFFNANEMNFDKWQTNYALGMKVYIAKEKLEDNHKVVRNHKILEIIHYAFLTIIWTIILGILWKIVW